MRLSERERLDGLAGEDRLPLGEVSLGVIRTSVAEDFGQRRKSLLKLRDPLMHSMRVIGLVSLGRMPTWIADA